jgi:hypothetical protein
MKSSSIYLALSIVGAILPWLFVANYLLAPDASMTSFIASVFANSVSTAVAMALIFSALVFFVFAFREGKRVGMQHIWAIIPATLLVGLSFGLPLFLYRRAKLRE